MNKQVNFEDDIFILMMRIRMIRDTITLDADPELFLEKILDDIYFTDHTLRILLEYLKEHNRFFEREELAEHYAEAEWQFSQVIQDLLDHNGNISIREIPAINDKITGFINSSLERRRTAENFNAAKESVHNSPIVSSDELTELLKAF
jgi:hypothetical protein